MLAIAQIIITLSVSYSFGCVNRLLQVDFAAVVFIIFPADSSVYSWRKFTSLLLILNLCLTHASFNALLEITANEKTLLQVVSTAKQKVTEISDWNIYTVFSRGYSHTHADENVRVFACLLVSIWVDESDCFYWRVKILRSLFWLRTTLFSADVLKLLEILLLQ